MSSVSHDASKCPCGVCHLKRVESGAQDAYERELRAATDKVLDRLKRGGDSEPEDEEESDDSSDGEKKMDEEDEEGGDDLSDKEDDEEMDN